LIAVISRHTEALHWAQQRCAECWGPIALESPLYAFDETDYYASTMGRGLWKQFILTEPLVDVAMLADWKTQSNAWESEYAGLQRHEERRPLNLDPGYLTLSKLVLASTKNHAHRIYLRGGIFAELTLQYRHRHWQPLPWTYPDYRRDDFHRFFDQVRQVIQGWTHGSSGR
jgi:hypothetical protein